MQYSWRSEEGLDHLGLVIHMDVYHPGILHMDVCTVVGAGNGTCVIWKDSKYSTMKPSL